ncbi:S-adenosyl-L-methionine-dependent methyltransferase [Daedalea quercina L-15889]|uniref:S-adenosyl-L-methionine-dependent methyltransferase n=1 Tax=Daedalea quercina L-15889 TaxID=1314783 RepID=A0A165U0P0_9APHY|nr:S-adenosyl-L-methionine-dependent methyltransferase [Daedalea quercina L-15889]
MPASNDNSNRAQTLRSLVRLLVDYSEVVTKEWEAEDQYPEISGLPSHELFEAQRIIRGACGMCINLVGDPRTRLFEVALSFTLSQSLDTTLRAGVPNILAEAEPDGVRAEELSRCTGIGEQKLVRLMRVLCSDGLYEETEPLWFTNTRISRVLAGNPPASAFQCLYGTMAVTGAMEHLPTTLLAPTSTNSTFNTETAFQKAHKTQLSPWDLIENGDGSDPMIAEIREMFPLAMIGQGQMSSTAVVADFPWASLGEGTVVDVGGGVGSMCLDLAKLFPDLRFVVEDLPTSIEKAKPIWNAEIPGALESGRVNLITHDFFTKQPVKNAAAYILRYILHDWPDDACTAILSKLRDAMCPQSRILIADMIMHPPLGSTHLKSAPAPLLANYGQANAFKGMHDISMLSMFNGSERSPEQLEVIANKAGLRIEKIWECRAPISITELRQL